MRGKEENAMEREEMRKIVIKGEIGEMRGKKLNGLGKLKKMSKFNTLKTERERGKK